MGGRRRRRSHGGEAAATAAATATAAAEVEVSRDGGAAWYEAVVSRVDKRRRRFTVVYSSILSDEDPSIPLEESVPRSRLRPRPPRGVAPRFALHQPVDAFGGGGWRTGIVAEVHICGEGREALPDRYTVCFPAAGEAAEFAPAEVRPHLLWARGRWLAPEDHMEVGKAEFSVGQLVEVTREKENYGTAWYSAIVVKVIRRFVFLVEYISLEADGGKLLREIVDRQYMRPTPPQWIETKAFELQDEVEAFYKDRWLPAVVSMLLPNSKYVVRPKHKLEDELEFDHSKLRPHKNWDCGRWVSISEGKCRTKSKVGHKRKSQAGKRPSSPISVSESDDEDETDNEPQSDILTFSGNNLEKQFVEGGTKSPQSCKKLKNGESFLDNLQLLDRMCGRRSMSPNRRNMEPDVMDSPSLMSEQQCSEGQSNHKSTSFSHMVSKCQLYSSPEQDMSMSKGIMGSLVSGKEPCNLGDNKLKHQSETSNIDHSPSRCGTSEHVLFTENENCTGFQSPMATVPQGRKKKIAIRLPHRRGKPMRPHSSEETATKERGRPRKMSSQDKNGMESRSLGDTPNKAVEIEREMDEADGSSMVSVDISQEIHDSENDVMRLEYSPQVLNAGNNITISNHRASQFNPSNVHHFMKKIELFAGGYTLIKNLRPQKLSNLTMSSFKVRIGKNSNPDEFIGGSNEAETLALISAAGNNISTCHEEISPCWSSPEKFNAQKIMPLFDPTHSGSVTQKRALPFIKNSPIWESIESMEIFHIMPQQPHFRSLEKYSTEFREGMAIGMMVTFANVVSSINRISIADRHEKFEEKLKALILLEDDGFNVDRVRSRVEELLEIRRNKRQMESNKEAFKGKISALELVKDHLNGIVPALDIVIMEMRQNLACLCEKRTLAIIQGKNIDSEIIKFLKDVTATEETFFLAENQFATLLAAPW